MAYRTLELTLISANDLKHVTFISKMEVYAVSSIDGNPSSQQRTPADREGGTSPVWNTTLRLSIPPGDPNNHFLHVLLRCHRILGVRDIGEVRIPLKELLNCFAEGRGDRQFVSYQLRNLPYKFLDVTPLRADEPVKALRDGEPVTGYPYAATPSTRATPPYANTSPPPGYGYLESDPADKDGSVVNLSYKFLDAAPLRADEPVTAYRYTSGPSSRALGAPSYAQPYQPPAGYGQPPAGYWYFPAGGALPYAQTYLPPAGNGYPTPAYGYPPAGVAPPYAQPYLSPAGYGNPAPAPAGYGYPPVGYGNGATQSSWNRFGTGMELLSGALRVGVLIGNILSGGSGGSYSDGGGFSDG